MALLKGHKTNFNTMLRAARSGDLALMECMDAKTQQPVAVLCMTNRQPDHSVVFVPVAKMFDGNPYDELVPPMAEAA